MNDQDKEAFEKWYQEYFKISGITILNIPHHFTEAWRAACEYKQKEIDALIDSSKLEFDKWYSSGMRKEFFEEKRAYDLYYNYTKDVCTYRNLAAVKEKNDALKQLEYHKFLLEKLQAENAKLNQEIEKFKGYLEAWRIDE